MKKHINDMKNKKNEINNMAAFLHVEARVRYWEDAEVNGAKDTDGTLIPLRKGELWIPVIELASGKILDWPEGVTASIHYKVCDQGEYFITDSGGAHRWKWEGEYVPDKLLCIGDRGYGDYIIFDVGEDGKIKSWERPVLDGDDWKKTPADMDAELVRTRKALCECRAELERRASQRDDRDGLIHQLRSRLRESTQAEAVEAAIAWASDCKRCLGETRVSLRRNYAGSSVTLESLLILSAEVIRLRDDSENQAKWAKHYLDRAMRTEDENERLRELTQWRPIATFENMTGVYLVWHKSGMACLLAVEETYANYIFSDGIIEPVFHVYGECTHWQPLPPPPEGKDGAE